MHASFFSWLVILALLAGCSHRQVYDAIQHNRRVECQKQPSREYQECIESTKETYESYQRKRDENVGK